MKLRWKRERGSSVQAPISHGGKAHHYVISHRHEDHTVSYRPPGKHHHVGSYRSERDAKAAAQKHADTGAAPPSNTASSIAAWGSGGPPKEWLDHATKRGAKTKAQLDREIAQSLASGGQPQLAAMFSDPAACKVFARELRHELQKKEIARGTAAHRAARPFTVKRVEQIGDRRVRGIVGNFATESEARARADQIGGWVETRDGRLVYGRQEEP